MTRLPLVPTAMVALAVPAMVALGFWQLDRREWKARAVVAFEQPVRSRIRCDSAPAPLQVGGDGPRGAPGFAHRADCGDMTVDFGWSRGLVTTDVPRGRWIEGRVYRYPTGKPLLVAEAPPPPLLPSAPPSAANIPNNHLAYAVQWFAFALTLAIIYARFVWLRARARPPGRGSPARGLAL